MPRAVGPDPGQGIVVQHATHNVHVELVVCVLSRATLQDLALGVVVVRHVQTNDIDKATVRLRSFDASNATITC